MRALLAILSKDLRLLWRDRAGLIFLTVAPIMVITVAGFSLANLYGADPTGQTAYDLPFVDEDGSHLAASLRERLGRESAVRLHPVLDRAAAQRLVEGKHAGTALIVPSGTAAALAAGQPATLVLLTDPVKYLERLNVQSRLLQLGTDLAAEERAQVMQAAAAEREHVQDALTRLRAALRQANDRLQAAGAEARRARQAVAETLRAQLKRTQQEVAERVNQEAGNAAASAAGNVEAQVTALTTPLRAYFESLAAARAAFEDWLNDLKRRAGSHAADIPPPPVFPEVPEALRQVLDNRQAPVRLPALHVHVDIPALTLPELPSVPDLPELPLPDITLPGAPVPPGALSIEEVNVTRGSITINTFDQNVPGFSVTFLLLGMLLGVSLGLLDERDWGTFDRMRAMPVTAAHVLVGKLLSRFIVGVVQMLALFAVGWLAFGISLGPQPWALLLPTLGIVFAGTAFGVIVAAVATTREAVLPVGSIVIVTMAAVGGCWWPIDLEPRWMRTLALAFPTTWAMDAFNDLMIRRRAAAVALLPTAVLLAYGAAYLTVGILLFQRQLRRRAR